ncbi:MAG: nitrogenase component 1, partial [Clostridium butyricum]|nr:nitrogenase component 1 [Clostridium butyricum]
AIMSVNILDKIKFIENLIKTNDVIEDNEEKAILVGSDTRESLEELKELTEACNIPVLNTVFQSRNKIDAAFYIGRGKVLEIASMRQVERANVVIFDDELSGSQVRNLEAAIGAKVIDRTTLILEIFATRAKTKEAKIQVELAQLKYRLSRLQGLGTILSRTGGGIGTRGPGEKKLERALEGVIKEHNPKAIFVYSTCIVGVIGDDIKAVCKSAEQKYNLPVIPVMAPGFSGNKSKGYRIACNALMNLFSREKHPKSKGINILGDFNLAGEMWIIENYLREIGVDVVAKITGDADVDSLKKASSASFNVVQCAGSMNYLAKMMEEDFSIPSIKISFVGLEDTKSSLMRIAALTGDNSIIEKAKELIEREEAQVMPIIEKYKKNL